MEMKGQEMQKAQVKNEPLVVERTFDAPVALVWKVLTEKEHMKEWYFELEEFHPEIGFAFDFMAGPPDGKKFHHACKVTDVVPERRLSYSWRYLGYPGESQVTFELFAEGEKTRLRLTHAGLETFPANVPELAAGNFEEGWNYILGTALAGYLQSLHGNDAS